MFFWEHSSYYIEGFNGYDVAAKYQKFLRSLPSDVRNLTVNKTTTAITEQTYVNETKTRVLHTILLTYEILAYGEDSKEQEISEGKRITAADIANEDVE